MCLHMCMYLDYLNDDDMTANETCFAKDIISRTPCHPMTAIATTSFYTLLHDLEIVNDGKRGVRLSPHLVHTYTRRDLGQGKSPLLAINFKHTLNKTH